MPNDWGRFVWWLNQRQNAAAMQAIIAGVQAILTLPAIIIAIAVPWWQQRNLRKFERQKSEQERAALRIALREEGVDV